MNKTMPIVVALTMLMTACGPSADEIAQTFVAQTATSEQAMALAISTGIAETQTAAPTRTFTPTETRTITPSPTSTSTATATVTSSYTPTPTETPTDTPLAPAEQTAQAEMTRQAQQTEVGAATQTASAQNATSTREALSVTQTEASRIATATRQKYIANTTATAAARPSGLTFLQIEDKYYAYDPVTEDDKWNEYRASLNGTVVQWTGQVLDAFGDTLLLDMGQYAFDRMIALHRVPAVTVDNTKIGQWVTFVARITEVTYYSDVHLNLVEMKY